MYHLHGGQSPLVITVRSQHVIFQILTRGIACHTNNCKTRMHYHCFATFRRRQAACPTCRAPWPQTPNEQPLVPVGEGASRSDGDAGRSRRPRGSVASDDDDDDDEDEENEESVGLRSQPMGRTQRARKGKSKQTQSTELDEDEEGQEVAETRRKGPMTRRSSRK